jgi:hypothetical protein
MQRGPRARRRVYGSLRHVPTLVRATTPGERLDETTLAYGGWWRDVDQENEGEAAEPETELCVSAEDPDELDA